MSVDYRIYLTLYAVCVMLYMGSIPLIMSDKYPNAWRYLFGGSLGGAALIGFVNFLDWLWA